MTHGETIQKKTVAVLTYLDKGGTRRWAKDAIVAYRHEASGQIGHLYARELRIGDLIQVWTEDSYEWAKIIGLGLVDVNDRRYY